MTIDPRSWTLNTEAIESNQEWGQEWFLPKIDIMVREGVLVLDTRLQDIADAWNRDSTNIATTYARNEIHQWLPELGDLLDALTTEVPSAGTDGNKENTDE